MLFKFLLSACLVALSLNAHAGTLHLNGAIDSPAIQGPACPVPVEIRMASPMLVPEDFGAKADGVTDDTKAIQAALDATGVGSVALTPGKVYNKAGTLYLRKTNVQLWGYGATLFTHSFRPPAPRTAVMLTAPGAKIYGVTLISDLTARGTSDSNSTGITLASTGNVAIDNSVQYTQVGIMTRQATGFTIARNVIYRTLADGIHITSGSQNGQIFCNVVRQNGDDGISVVGYGAGEPQIGGFSISWNDVGDSYKGRGITVVGAHDVTIAKNTIADIHMGAGIYVASEWQYKTFKTRRVLVESNNISRIRLGPATAWNPLGPAAWVDTGQPAIFVYGTKGFEVSDVQLVKNIITRPRKNGIEISATSCNVLLDSNVFNEVPIKQIQDSSAAGCVVQAPPKAAATAQ